MALHGDEGEHEGGRLRNLYKAFRKVGIMPSELDNQDYNILLWLILSEQEERDNVGGDYVDSLGL